MCFFKSRVEFVGHDLTASGNYPAQSKFNLIQDWPLPTDETALLSFIGLCSFYSRPWFDTGIKPLRRLQRLFHHAELPIMAWSPSTISLFIDYTTNIVSSPLLLRYGSSKLVFLKTDWSANGMRYILMQPDNCSESIQALAILEESGDCTFELSLKGPRLHPVLFGSRSNLPYEMNYHSFVGEIACGRWSIAHNRRYLWGKKFY